MATTIVNTRTKTRKKRIRKCDTYFDCIVDPRQLSIWDWLARKREKKLDNATKAATLDN